MQKVEIVLQNETGLHARPASIFVKEASKYTSEVTIVKDGTKFNGKSIMGILSMGASKGDKLEIIAEGDDEKEAVEALKELVENNFGE
ncbi:HPr family phosphocarrier protein [Caldisalinibacter kiritimatiensis]|uniref:Phosphocarrier protein HPr n=1 Tax=Caldisalinibacter kiritimatiensis TaxID=1304284 RepID=R1CSH0_9FIRM|nr:HPr family phosphocarrier protein [Caldisalinibacter kiritimatiensis]EOC99653.1 Catabolite repression HPr-like protein Crh [Caldisalinibacter kiritimatiensis]